MTATAIRPSTPELESAKLFRHLLAARRMATLAHEHARMANAEAAALQAVLETVEAEYRAAKQECGA